MADDRTWVEVADYVGPCRRSGVRFSLRLRERRRRNQTIPAPSLHALLRRVRGVGFEEERWRPLVAAAVAQAAQARSPALPYLRKLVDLSAAGPLSDRAIETARRLLSLAEERA